MTDASAERGSDATREERAPAEGRARLVAALRVREYAGWGLASGVLVAAAVYLRFVVFAAAPRDPVRFLGLAFVLATAVAAVVTTLLVGAEAYSLASGDAVDPDERA
ncbi:MAG: hypothetical protein ABEI98_05690 [Halorhabdus sp.]